MQLKCVQMGAILTVGLILVQLAAAADEAKTRRTKTRAANGEVKETRSQQAKRANEAAAKKTKLQSRVMRSAGPIEPAAESPLGPDAWHQHSLMPTFVDQEQGDEMVALASDSSELAGQPQHVKVVAAPQLNGSSLSSLSDSYMKRYQADRLQREQQVEEEERFFARQEQQEKPAQDKARASSLVPDDYYADDDDDDEPQQPEQQGAQVVGQTNKFNRQTKADTPPNGRASEQTLANFRPIEQSSGVVKQAERNSSEQVANPQRANANGWLPTGGSAISKPPAEQDQRPAAAAANSMGRAERAAGFFGSRGEPASFGNSLSKTDMAIEYLRNILKSKQSRLQSGPGGGNSSQAGQQQQQQQQQQREASHDIMRFDKSLMSYYPLPAQLREFAPPVNRTAASDQVKLTASELQEAAPGRFSINDVKQRQIGQELASSTAAPLVSITTDSGAGTSLKQAETKPTAAPETRPSPPAGLDLALMNQADGAPLGAEFSESHEAVPRGFPPAGQPQAGRGPPPDFRQKTAESMAAMASEQLADDKFHFRPHQTFGPAHSTIYFDLRKPAEVRPQAEFKDEVQQQHQQQVAPEPVKPVQSTQQNFNFDQANLDELKLEQQIEQIPLQEARVPRPSAGFGTKSFEAPAEQVVEPVPKVDELASLERAPLAQVKVMPVKEQPAQRQMISSKLYRNELPPWHFGEPQQQVAGPQVAVDQNRQRQAEYGAPRRHQSHQSPKQAAPRPAYQQPAYSQPPPPPPQQQQPRFYAPQPPQLSHQAAGYERELPTHQAEHKPARAPRIVSYNYFESADGEHGNQATNFQLGDSLLSSTGDIEHTLSNTELDAIQSQFMTAEHPVVPVGEQPPRSTADKHHRERRQQQQQHQQHELSKLLAGFKTGQTNEVSQRLSADPLRELASEEHQVGATEPSVAQSQGPAQSGEPKRKSLVVYLNHPRGDEMSRAASNGGGSLAQLISEQTSGDPFVTAREFDSRGLSKDSTRLDVASLQQEGPTGGGVGGLPKEALVDKDKDGLSVVVIGDAYKYKKIVLLISAKTGGLKFVPMVKDMRRR